MTFLEYKKYEKSVRDFFKREGIKIMSVDHEVEPFFSWSNCECCGRKLGGDRYTMNVVFNNGENTDITYDICVDCMYYNEYGKLDDMTMMDMDKETKKAKAEAKIAANDTWGTNPVSLKT